MNKNTKNLKLEQEQKIADLITKNNSYFLNTFNIILINLFLATYIFGIVLLVKWIIEASQNSYSKSLPILELALIALVSLTIASIYFYFLNNSIATLFFGNKIKENSALYNELTEISFSKIYEDYLQQKISKNLKIECKNEKPLFYNEIISTIEDKKFTFTFKPTKPKFMYWNIVWKSYLIVTALWIILVTL